MGLFSRKQKTGTDERVTRQDEISDASQSAGAPESTWEADKVALELLARFYRGADPWKFIGKDHWSDVLGEKVEVALERLQKEGALVQAPVAIKLLQRYSSEDLRFHLGESGLSQTGDRKTLVRRLMKEDAVTTRRLASEINVLILSKDASMRVVEYVKSERERREIAERHCLVGLLQHDYLRATAMASEYQRDSVFSRGVGIAEEDDDMSANVAVLQLLFERTPQLLGDIDGEVLEKFRAPAGMAFLWGRDTAVPWIRSDMTVTGPLVPEVVSAMLLAHARHLYDVEQYRKSGRREFKLWCNHDAQSCATCRTMHGKQFRLDAIPELPHADCTSASGCRCKIVVADQSF